MATQLHDSGEEFLLKLIYESDTYGSPPSNVNVGLFHDGEVSGDTSAGDDLSDSSTMSAITTEPGGSNYGTATVSLDSTGFNTSTDGSNDWQAANANTLQFTLDDSSSGTVDAWYMSASFDANNDGSATEQLIVTGNLSQSYDLSNVDQLDLNPGGVGHNIT